MEYVEDGARQAAVVERGQKRAVIDEAAAGDVDQDGALLEPGEEGLSGHAARVVGQGASEHHHVGLVQERRQVRRGAHPVDIGRGNGRAADDVDAGLERLHALGDGLPDWPEADDQPARLRDLAEGRAAPFAPFLQVALQFDGVQHGEHLGERVLRNGDALRAAVADARALGHELLVEGMIEAGVEGLQHLDAAGREAQFEGRIAETVRVQVRRQPHVVDLGFGGRHLAAVEIEKAVVAEGCDLDVEAESSQPRSDVGVRFVIHGDGERHEASFAGAALSCLPQGYSARLAPWPAATPSAYREGEAPPRGDHHLHSEEAEADRNGRGARRREVDQRLDDTRTEQDVRERVGHICPAHRQCRKHQPAEDREAFEAIGMRPGEALHEGGQSGVVRRESIGGDPACQHEPRAQSLHQHQEGEGPGDEADKGRGRRCGHGASSFLLWRSLGSLKRKGQEVCHAGLTGHFLLRRTEGWAILRAESCPRNRLFGRMRRRQERPARGGGAARGTAAAPSGGLKS